MITVIRNNYTPALDDYQETIVIDRELSKKYIFDCDGVFTEFSSESSDLYEAIGQNTDGAMTQKATSEMVFHFNERGKADGVNIATQEGLSKIYIGQFPSAYKNIGDYAIQVSSTNAFAKGRNSICIGQTDSKAYGNNSVAIGSGVEALGNNSIAIGQSSVGKSVSGSEAIGIGNAAEATASNSTAIGARAKASHNYSIALGAGAATTRANELKLGNLYIGGLRDGVENNDAVTVGQLNTAIGSIKGGFDPYDRDSSDQPIGINITDAMATYIKLGNYARTDGTHDAISIGNNAHTTGQTSVSLGGYTEATGEQTTALGNNAKVYKYNSTAVGASAITGNNADGATAVGHDAQVYSQEGTAIGNQAVVNTNAYRGVAVGAGSVIYADAQKSVAINGKAKKDYSVALGYGAEARHSESVAIGYDSYTTRDREVSIGGRFLTGLTDGVNNNDAVTVSQLNTAVGNIETLLEAI